MMSRPVAFGSSVPQWPTFLMPKLAADGVHDIVRRRAGGFINENGAVECGKFLHENENYFAAFSARFTAAMTLRCTASGLPGMRAPAAAGWPPPPNCAADFADVHLGAFRAQADARHFRLHFLEHAGDDDRLNRAEVVNQAFRVVALRAGAGEILFLQPEPRDAVVVGQPEFAVNMLEQLCARQRDTTDKPRRKFSPGSRRA